MIPIILEITPRTPAILAENDFLSKYSPTKQSIRQRIKSKLYNFMALAIFCTSYDILWLIRVTIMQEMLLRIPQMFWIM